MAPQRERVTRAAACPRKQTKCPRGNRHLLVAGKRLGHAELLVGVWEPRRNCCGSTPSICVANCVDVAKPGHPATHRLRSIGMPGLKAYSSGRPQARVVLKCVPAQMLLSALRAYFGSLVKKQNTKNRLDGKSYHVVISRVRTTYGEIRNLICIHFI